MHAMLLDHLAQHRPHVPCERGARVDLVDDRDLLPHDEPEPVAFLEHRLALRVVGESYEVEAVGLDAPHVVALERLRHRAAVARAVLVAIRAVEAERPAVEQESIL
jgi:hypothetical protein